MSNNLEKYLSSWSYIANPIPMDEVGIFRVRGENANHEFQKELGIFSGKFEDIATYAVELPGFWQWDSGGMIEEIKIKPITAESVEKRKVLLDEQNMIKKRLKEIEENLGE